MTARRDDAGPDGAERDEVRPGGRGDDARRTAEVLDLGVVGDPSRALDVPDPGSPGPVSRRGLLGAAGLLAAGVAGVLGRRTQGSRPWTSTSPAPARAVEDATLPRPLPGVPDDWDLFGLGDAVLLRIHPASGRVTRTEVPSVGEGQVSFVPVRRRVLIRPVTTGPGYVVPDGGPPTVMPPALAGVGAVLPGPDQDHVWTQVDQGGTTQMTLVTLDGRPAGVEVPVPEFAATGPMTDGAGGVLFEGVGGLYSLSPRGRLRVDNAILLAVGPGTLLTLERGTRGRWRTLLRFRDGRVRTVPVAIGPQLSHGVLAPDGRTVVLYVPHEPVTVSPALVDLAAGVPDAQRVRELAVSVRAGEGTIVWSPDSRRLVGLDGLGRLTVIEAATGAAATLAPDLPSVRQLAVR